MIGLQHAELFVLLFHIEIYTHTQDYISAFTLQNMRHIEVVIHSKVTEVCAQQNVENITVLHFA
jgi:archaellum biogenesis protein FlaJ (TadC family)